MGASFPSNSLRSTDEKFIVCMYVCMYVRTYVRTYVCMLYVCMYVRMYVCTYVCMYVLETVLLVITSSFCKQEIFVS